jgi:23S rRNA pseudouridine1911/1915/1917 synthase
LGTKPTVSREGERLDVHLVRLGHAQSRRAARSLIEQGLVRVNGRLGRKGALVAPCDRIDVAQTGAPRGIEPNPGISLEVLFQDECLLVVNKPAPMPCHPLRSGERETVMNAVVARFPETGLIGDDPREGGLVHRLDNGTSGALIIAREARAWGMLRAALRNGLIERRYEALVAGELKSQLRLDQPIGHHPKNPRKMVVLADAGDGSRRGARQALTLVEPIAPFGNFTLVSVIPKTGNRHQIRVHLASAGHPLAGDSLYGGSPIAALADGRFWLHLRRVELDSPASGRITVEAPRPDDLADALNEVSSRA